MISQLMVVISFPRRRPSNLVLARRCRRAGVPVDATHVGRSASISSCGSTSACTEGVASRTDSATCRRLSQQMRALSANSNTHSRPPTLDACIPPFTVRAPHSSPLTVCASYPFHARSSRAVLDEEFFIRAKLLPNERCWKHASLATFLTFVNQRFTLKKSPTGAFVYGNAAPTSHGALEPRRKHARAARTAAAPPPRRVQATSRTAPSLSTRLSPLAFLVLRASSGVRTPRRLVMRACCRLPDARCAPSSTSHGLKRPCD